MCHGSFVKMVFDLVQLAQAGAAPKRIKALAEEISPYSTALLTQVKTNEDMHRWHAMHAQQTATETNSEAIPLQASPGKVLNKSIAAKEDRSADKSDRIIELLERQCSLTEKSTAVNKKGFASLKPIDIRLLTELIKTLPPPAAGEDENWLSVQTVALSTGESVDNLKKQRSEERGGKKITIDGSEYGRDTEGRIWFKVSDRVFLYYEATISGQDLSR